jgi:hypothetical protein
VLVLEFKFKILNPLSRTARGATRPVRRGPPLHHLPGLPDGPARLPARAASAG